MDCDGQQKAKENLRAAVLAILGEPTLAQAVLIRGFKIKSGHVVENRRYLFSDNSFCIIVGYLLDFVLESSASINKTTKHTVNPVRRNPDVKISFEILDSLQLGPRIKQPANDKMAEQFVVQTAISNMIVQRAIHQLRSDDLNPAIGKTADEIVDYRILFVEKRQLRTTAFRHPLSCFQFEPLNV